MVQAVVWVCFAIICVVAALLVTVRVRGAAGVSAVPPSPLDVRPTPGRELPAAMAGPPAPPPLPLARPLPRVTSRPDRTAPARPSPSSLGNRSGLRNTASGRWSRPITTNRPTAGGGHAEASALAQS